MCGLLFFFIYGKQGCIGHFGVDLLHESDDSYTITEHKGCMIVLTTKTKPKLLRLQTETLTKINRFYVRSFDSSTALRRVTKASDMSSRFCWNAT